jgi:hypothetical protein
MCLFEAVTKVFHKRIYPEMQLFGAQGDSMILAPDLVYVRFPENV